MEFLIDWKRAEARDDYSMQSRWGKGGNRRGAHGEGAGVGIQAQGRWRRAEVVGEEEEDGGLGVLLRDVRRRAG